MTCKFILPVVALLCLSLMPHPVMADPVSDAKDAIQIALNNEDAAFARKDLLNTFSSHATDFVSVDSAGKTATRAQGIILAKNLFSAAKILSSSDQVTDVVLTGKEAQVQVANKTTVIMTHVDTLADVKYTSDETDREYWILQDGTWVQKRSRTLTLSKKAEIIAGSEKQNGSIVGKWQTTIATPTGGFLSFQMEYTADGKERQATIENGLATYVDITYTAQNGKLAQTFIKQTINGQVTYAHGEVRTFRYKVDGDTLAFIQPGNPFALMFTRVKP